MLEAEKGLQPHIYTDIKRVAEKNKKAGIFLFDPVFPRFSNPLAVELSLGQFIFRETRQGTTNDRFNQYVKQSSSLCLDKIHLKGFRSNRALAKDHPRFYVDGDYGIVLQETFSHSQSYDRAVISFLIVNMHTKRILKEKGLDTNVSLLLVVQMQGRKGSSEFLSQMNWERMLLKLTCDWAIEAGFKRISVQPGGLNAWNGGNGLTQERAKLRYDITARRAGFYKDADGKYALNLQQQPHDREN